MAFLVEIGEVPWFDGAAPHTVDENPGFVLFALFCCALVFQSAAQQNSASNRGQAEAGELPTFAQAVTQYFSDWDSNGDGKLSREELEAAVGNPKFHTEAAAALAAIDLVVTSGKYTLPAITREYLVSSPLREQTLSEQQADSADDVSKPEKFTHQPAFQPRYVWALDKLRLTSRELFPQSLPSFEATHQGKLGDCPFVSTVGAMLYRDPAAVKSMFSQDENGATTVSFGDGRKFKVTRITDADIAIWSSAGSNGLWLTVLEKAYRRILVATEHPGQQNKPNIYDRIGSTRTIEILDGHQTRTVELKSIRAGSAQFSALRRDLTTALREHRLVKAATPVTTKTPGIVENHAYAILGYNQDADTVKVWNPWGKNFTPKGFPTACKTATLPRLGCLKSP